MATPNAIITFSALRALTGSVLSGEEVSLNVLLTAFDQSTNVSKKTNVSPYTGRQRSTLFYIGRTWGIQIAEEGTVTLPDTSTTDLTADYVEMFLQSVSASEEFTITDIDNSDAEVIVQLDGSWSRQRRSVVDLNKFAYSFNVREVTV